MMSLDTTLRTMQRAAFAGIAAIMMGCSASPPPLPSRHDQQAEQREHPTSPSSHLFSKPVANFFPEDRLLPTIEAPPCVDADGDSFCGNYQPRDCNDENPFVTPESAQPASLFSLESGFIHNAVWDSDGTKVAFIQTGSFSGTPYPTFSEAWLTILDVSPDGSSGLAARHNIPLSSFTMPHDAFMYDFSGRKALYGVFEWTNEELVSAYGYGIFVADVSTGESTMIYQGIGTSEEGRFFDSGNKVLFECGRYECGFPELCIVNTNGSSLERVVDTWTVEHPHKISGWTLSSDESSILYTITQARAWGSPVCAPYPFDESDESSDEAVLYEADLAAGTKRLLTQLPLIPRYDELVHACHVELSPSNFGTLLIDLFDTFGAYECLVMDVASSSLQPLHVEESVTGCWWAAGGSSILLRHDVDEYQLLRPPGDGGDSAVSPRYRLENGGHLTLNPTATSILSVTHNSTYFRDSLVEQDDQVLTTYLPCGLLSEGL